MLPAMGVETSQNEGAAMHALLRRLYPICRSITGEGVRETLRILQETLPLHVHEVRTGTQVLDWTVPREWNVRDAWLADPRGRRFAEFRASNLHLVNYSAPFQGRLRLGELRRHLHSLPDRPDWTPYRTTYYNETWGFCLPHRQLEGLSDGAYEVCVDSTLADGHLTYGELYVPGRSDDELLISTHICHPSLANDNLSGIVTAAFLAAALAREPPPCACRFLFIPGTLGSIVWLARNEERLSRIRHGLVLAGVGDAGALTYKKSRRGDAEIDRLAARLVRARGGAVEPFVPYGYDERQFCSPGFDLPVGCLSRTPFSRYPEYHTSADNPDFVRPGALADTLGVLRELLDTLARRRTWVNLSPRGEPQLGRRGLYDALGGGPDAANRRMGMLWALSLADGRHDLDDMAEKSGLPPADLGTALAALQSHGLLEERRAPPGAP